MLNLHEYEMLTEVPLTTSGGFMKADIMLVKRTTDGTVEDIVVIENKLSKFTDYTERQTEGFKAIGTAGSIKAEVPLKGFWAKGNLLSVQQSKCIKLFDHGKDDLSRVESELIDFSKF